MFNHMGPAVVLAMHDLTSGLVGHLELTSALDVDKRVNYTHLQIRVFALNKYKIVLADCKESEKGIYGYQWTLSATKDVTMDKFWTWAKLYGVNASGGGVIGLLQVNQLLEMYLVQVGEDHVEETSERLP